MRFLFLIGLALAIRGLAAETTEILFQDDFQRQLGAGWSWLREHMEAWRASEHGLEVRVEPGNNWGPQNNARNVLMRAAPEVTNNEVAISVTVENQPTNQYEQVDLVWYYDDANMVKLGQELVDGKLSVDMGREEQDKTRTVAIFPLSSSLVRLRLLVKGTQIRGQFCASGTNVWQDVGSCDLPSKRGLPPKLSIQCYQGPEKVEHWARISEFRI